VSDGALVPRQRELDQLPELPVDYQHMESQNPKRGTGRAPTLYPVIRLRPVTFCPMSSNDGNNTQTTDVKPEGEQDETPGPERLREPFSENTADEERGADTEASTAGARLETPVETDDTASGATADTASTSGFVAGGFAIVSAGLGLSSLTGTALGDMLRSRKEIMGQIEASTGGGGDQIEAFYGAPWHTAALVNGILALVAVLIGGVLLAALARRVDTRPWVKAVALGGVVLGAVGILVAGGMYLDLFAAQPELPATPMPGTGG
jgi:hypothetical protein